MTGKLEGVYTEYRKLHSNLRLAIEAAIFGTLAGFGQLWFFDLFAHFRLHYCIIFLGLMLWAVYRRAWLLLLPLTVLIAINAGVLLSWHGQLAQTSAREGPGLRVVAANILSLPVSPDKVRQYLSDETIDIAILSEYSVHWHALFRTWNLPLTYSVTRPQPDNFGIALFSRWPLEDIEVTGWGIKDAVIPGIMATAVTPLGRIRVIAAHPPPPAMPFLGRWRNTILSQVSRLISASDLPVIAAGDLNATPWSYPLSNLLSQPGIKGGSFYGTWPSLLPQLGIPIDHIIVKGPLAFTDYKTGLALGSDHRPVEAVLVKSP